ncbi:MAG: hypothetical protein IPP72_08675 [Chitinophagaceae bacterium]|nr:hypothetical protein [Chitinophagaceae bacterium]
MKKIILLLLVVFMGQLSFAQVKENKPVEFSKKTPENKMRHKKGMHEKRAMMKALNLTEEQKAKLKEMNAGNKEKKLAILNDSKLTEEQKKEQLRAIKKGQVANMQTILTDEQKVKMKEIKMKMKEAKKNRREMKMKKEAGESKPQEAAPAVQNQ